MKRWIILFLIYSSSHLICQTKYAAELMGGLFSTNGPDVFSIEANISQIGEGQTDYFLSAYYIHYQKGYGYGDMSFQATEQLPVTYVPVDVGFKYYFLDRNLSPYFVGETGIVFWKEDKFNLTAIPLPEQNSFIYETSIEKTPLKMYVGFCFGFGLNIKITENFNLDLATKIHLISNNDFKSGNWFFGGGINYEL